VWKIEDVFSGNEMSGQVSIEVDHAVAEQEGGGQQCGKENILQTGQKPCDARHVHFEILTETASNLALEAVGLDGLLLQCKVRHGVRNAL
jgi:hypothetical protein